MEAVSPTLRSAPRNSGSSAGETKTLPGVKLAEPSVEPRQTAVAPEYDSPWDTTLQGSLADRVDHWNDEIAAVAPEGNTATVDSGLAGSGVILGRLGC